MCKCYCEWSCVETRPFPAEHAAVEMNGKVVVSARHAQFGSTFVYQHTLYLGTGFVLRQKGVLGGFIAHSSYHLLRPEIRSSGQMVPACQFKSTNGFQAVQKGRSYLFPCKPYFRCRNVSSGSGQPNPGWWPRATNVKGLRRKVVKNTLNNFSETKHNFSFDISYTLLSVGYVFI